MLRGLVHDPTARQMGGVAGHAGLFSTADDTAKFAQAMLNGGAPVWSKLTMEKMTTPQQPPNMTVLRGLGWDIDSPYSTNRGDLLPVGSFGHTGFTGTSLWIDPTTDYLHCDTDERGAREEWECGDDALGGGHGGGGGVGVESRRKHSACRWRGSRDTTNYWRQADESRCAMER